MTWTKRQAEMQDELPGVGTPIQTKLTAMIETLKTLRMSCKEALSGEWDRSDDGFEAMITSIDDALAVAGEVVYDEEPGDEGNV